MAYLARSEASISLPDCSAIIFECKIHCSSKSHVVTGVTLRDRCESLSVVGLLITHAQTSKTPSTLCQSRQLLSRWESFPCQPSLNPSERHPPQRDRKLLTRSELGESGSSRRTSFAEVLSSFPVSRRRAVISLFSISVEGFLRGLPFLVCGQPCYGLQTCFHGRSVEEVYFYPSLHRPITNGL